MTPAQLAALRRRVRIGRYRVAPELVAEAMLRRGERTLDGEVVGRLAESCLRAGFRAQAARRQRRA